MPIRHDSFHSEEVQAILGRAPSWVVRWGVTVVFAIFAGILAGCWFIKYPDLVEAPTTITTLNPPADLKQAFADSEYATEPSACCGGYYELVKNRLELGNQLRKSRITRRIFRYINH